MVPISRNIVTKKESEIVSKYRLPLKHTYFRFEYIYIIHLEIYKCNYVYDINQNAHVIIESVQ